MTTLTIGQAKMFAALAGFSGNSLNRIVAIGLCESGLQTDRRGIQDPRDRGWLQINSFWHPEVSDACAFDPACAAREAYRISSQGTNFNQWTTFQNGCSDTKMAQVAGQSAVQGTSTPVTTKGEFPLWTQPFMYSNMSTKTLASLPALVANLYSYHGGAIISGEGGVDWNLQPLDAPVTALLTGDVVGAGYFCGGGPWNLSIGGTCAASGKAEGWGVVTIRSINPRPDLVPGQFIDIYYQHIKIHPSIKMNFCQGVTQHIASGQQIGWGNGSFNIEVGVNVGTVWGCIWGGKSPGPHVDPIPFLYNIILAGAGTGNGTVTSMGGASQAFDSVSNSVHAIVNEVPGFTGIFEAMDLALQFQPLVLPGSTSSSTTSLTGDPTLDAAIAGTVTGVTDTLAPGALQLLGVDPNAKNISGLYSQILKPITLPSDSIQAILTFIVTNAGAFIFRALLVTIGMILLIGLTINIMNPEGKMKAVADIAPLFL